MHPRVRIKPMLWNNKYSPASFGLPAYKAALNLGSDAYITLKRGSETQKRKDVFYVSISIYIYNV
jgi:hypothetical protein